MRDKNLKTLSLIETTKHAELNAPLVSWNFYSISDLFPCLLQLWDVHMEGAPVATFKVHDFLHPKVFDLLLFLVASKVESCFCE